MITATDKFNVEITDSIDVNIDYEEISMDKIDPNLFKTNADEYLILTLNLHTYQEDRQIEKLYLISDLIGKMDIDFIGFQECAQNKNSKIVAGNIRENNMALIISKRIKEKYNIDYNYAWNWSHYGWNIYEEGLAVMSKYPHSDFEDRYISSNTNTSSITSRKAIYSSFEIPQGIINFFSVHTHWRTSLTDEEQNTQVKNLKAMISEKETLLPTAETFVCGDFNCNPTSDYPWSEGYNTMMNNNDFWDTFLEIYPDANNKPAQSKYYTVLGDFPGRIDYIFAKKNVHFQIIASQIIFTPEIIGTVSDHYGVLTKIKIIN